jgi:hypothetical protein
VSGNLGKGVADMSDANATWDADPQEALWYGEIVFCRDTTDDNGEVDGWETDYVYGYSTDPEPDPRDLCPDGAEVLEEKLVPLRGQDGREFLVWCENGDLVACTAEYEDAADALREAVRADIDRYGEQEAACGVLSTYGYSIDVVENGESVTQDFMNNNPQCPLDDDVIVKAGG